MERHIALVRMQTKYVWEQRICLYYQLLHPFLENPHEVSEDRCCVLSDFAEKRYFNEDMKVKRHIVNFLAVACSFKNKL